MQGHFTTTDGLRLAYDDSGSGLPLLCLAGLTRNMDDFDAFRAALGGGCRILRMDYRGRGASDHDPDPINYAIPREAADALELLDHLGIARAAVLGTSRGGLIAMALAVMAPARLIGAVLNDIGPRIEPEALAHIADYVGRTPRSPDLDSAARAAQHELAETFPGVPLAVWRREVAQWYRERPEGGLALRYDPRLAEGMAAQAALGPMPDLWPLFDALATKPLAALRGANSGLLSAGTFAEMRARAPDMLAAEVPDRGHVPFLDEPKSLAVIRSFLSICAAQDPASKDPA